MKSVPSLSRRLNNALSLLLSSTSSWVFYFFVFTPFLLRFHHLASYRFRRHNYLSLPFPNIFCALYPLRVVVVSTKCVDFSTPPFPECVFIGFFSGFYFYHFYHIFATVAYFRWQFPFQIIFQKIIRRHFSSLASF